MNSSLLFQVLVLIDSENNQFPFLSQTHFLLASRKKWKSLIMQKKSKQCYSLYFKRKRDWNIAQLKSILWLKNSWHGSEIYLCLDCWNVTSREFFRAYACARFWLSWMKIKKITGCIYNCLIKHLLSSPVSTFWGNCFLFSEKNHKENLKTWSGNRSDSCLLFPTRFRTIWDSSWSTEIVLKLHVENLVSFVSGKLLFKYCISRATQWSRVN